MFHFKFLKSVETIQYYWVLTARKGDFDNLAVAGRSFFLCPMREQYLSTEIVNK